MCCERRGSCEKNIYAMIEHSLGPNGSKSIPFCCLNLYSL